MCQLFVAYNYKKKRNLIQKQPSCKKVYILQVKSKVAAKKWQVNSKNFKNNNLDYKFT